MRQQNVYRTMRLTAALACLLIVGAATPARAHDHRPPPGILMTGDDEQRGHRHHADWVRRARDERFCIASFATGFRAFPRALVHQPGNPVFVRLAKASPPLEVEVLRWPNVDRNGHATGQPIPLPWTLRPHVVNNEVRAWDVVIPWIATVDRLYLDVGAYWADEEGCTPQPDLGYQYVAWTFHLLGRL